MKLSLIDVKQVFLEVLQKNISFEEASNWAHDIIQKDESGELECYPENDVSKIFAGITYLLGVDLEESPGVYFHSLKNVRDEYNDLFGNPEK